MDGVILDSNSFNRGDVNLEAIEQFSIDWTYYPSTRPDQIENRIRHSEIIITNKVVLDRQLLEKSENIKLILIAATGTDNIDLDYCGSNGITVCNVRNYATPAVIQHTIALILNLFTRQIDYHRDVVEGRWSNSDVFCLLDHPVSELQGKTLGIIGYGNLGKSVANIASSFGMEIKICQRPGGDPSPNRVPFSDLLPIIDVLSLHCPLTPQTKNLLGSDEFCRMKPSAFLVNTARGAIVDSEALVNALKNKQIAGAGIDVLDSEPPNSEHPLLQPEIPNLIVTPHNAWGSIESRQRLVVQLGDNLTSWLNGTPTNVVS